MANVDTNVAATGSYRIGIDSDSDSAAQTFEVRTNGGSLTLIQVGESGGVFVLGLGDFSAQGIATRSLAGAPTGGQDGEIAVDSTNKRLYVRVAGVWRYVTLT